MEVDPRSATWGAVTDFYSKELEIATSTLESASMSHAETQFIRGYIKAFRELSKLPKDTQSGIRSSVSVDYG
jgi:hypothetical protein